MNIRLIYPPASHERVNLFADIRYIHNRYLEVVLPMRRTALILHVDELGRAKDAKSIVSALAMSKNANPSCAINSKDNKCSTNALTPHPSAPP